MTANAVSGLGMFNYSQMGYDPYFLQAFNSPNVNQMYQSQQVPAQQTAQQVSQALAGNPSFQGAQTTTTEKKGNGKAWLLIGGAAALAGVPDAGAEAAFIFAVASAMILASLSEALLLIRFSTTLAILR